MAFPVRRRSNRSRLYDHARRLELQPADQERVLNRDQLKQVVAPALAVAAAAIVFAIAGYMTADARGSRAPRAPQPSAQEATIQGQLAEITADHVTVSANGISHTYPLKPGAVREVMRLASVAEIRPGDWLNAGATSHSQTTYAITAFVLIPREQLEAAK